MIKIKSYKINLDLPSEVLWNNVIDDHKNKLIPAINKVSDIFKTLGFKEKFILTCTKTIINRYSSPECAMYIDELKAVSKRGKVPLDKLILMQLCYEWFFACTSIVLKINDSVLHFRTMDMDMQCLKDLTIELHFYKNGSLIFKAVSWAGCVGIMTGMVPNKYSIALNYRRSNENLYGRISRVLGMNWPASFLIRNVLESGSSFGEAYNILCKTKLASPCYITLCNPVGESYVLIRDPDKICKIINSDTYLIQTNKDNPTDGDHTNNILYSNQRYDTAKNIISKELPNWKSHFDIINSLNIFPIINDDTLYITVMRPDSDEIVTIIPQ